ncbi:Digalactosyldiacylglycerol synthase 1 chloroplastic [Bienertia sinuspersici]
MKDRANSFKNLASSFDRELENFINSASSFSVPAIKSTTNSEIDFVKKLQPKLIRIDLSAIRNAIVEEAEVDGGERVRVGKNRVRFREFKWDWKGEGEGEGESDDGEEGFKDWEPIRALKTKLKDFEVKKSPDEIFGAWKNNELVEKLKSSLKAFRWESQDSKEVPPLDVPELLAYFVRQSEPFLDQLGVRKVGSLCSKRKNQLLLHSLSGGDSSVIESDNVNDELDLRIASVLQSTGHHYDGGFWSDFVKHNPSDKKRHVAIVTTASLPWMTGTAVNPLFRAAYLAKSAKQKVTLLVPWLCKSDQELVYPNKLTFNSPEEQELYIKNWLEERTGFKADFKIFFTLERRSIIPTGDTTQFISSKDADIAILEEPEHLNWYHHGKRWTDKFNHVVGVVHTNYLEYIKREKNGALQAFFVNHINNLIARAHCHKVLRLSAATQDLPKSIVCNVHGVNPKFIEIGEKLASERAAGQQAFSREHISWARWYKVFINPSVSDVLCTATAEALAMGKFVVCADHPSNEFFTSFPNCFTYKTSEEFVAKVKEALAKEPQPLTPEQRYRLSWEAATERFMEHSDLEKLLEMDQNRLKPNKNTMIKSVSLPNLSDMVDGGMAFAHFCFTGSELLRLATGAIPGSRNYDKQHSKDLNLLPPQVDDPIYHW